eukprot:3091655-Heterocapsa_arctica.AAC.1
MGMRWGELAVSIRRDKQEGARSANGNDVKRIANGRVTFALILGMVMMMLQIGEASQISGGTMQLGELSNCRGDLEKEMRIVLMKENTLAREGEDTYFEMQKLDKLGLEGDIENVAKEENRHNSRLGNGKLEVQKKGDLDLGKISCKGTWNGRLM